VRRYLEAVVLDFVNPALHRTGAPRALSEVKKDHTRLAQLLAAVSEQNKSIAAVRGRG
jgi:hypothetical protein